MSDPTTHNTHTPSLYEAEIQKHLHREYPQLVERYKENRKQAEKIVLHQLVQAIIREGIIASEREENSFILRLKSDNKIVVPVKRQYLLGHIDIFGDLTYFGVDGNRRSITNSDELLSILKTDGMAETFPNIEQFHLEISNSTLNHALALTVADHRKQMIRQEAAQLETDSTLQYVLEKTRRDKHFSPLTFFEQWVVEGHSIHPCSRTRLGLSPRDISAYAPEWAGKPKVIPVAVHKDSCSMTSLSKNATEILLEEYPEVAQSFKNTLDEKRLSTVDYELIPIHPWQLKHTILHFYKKEIEQLKVIPLEGTKIETAALVSFRSLAPLKSKEKHHIKTAMNVQMTSAVRTVSAASTSNGPKISKVLQEIRKEDRFLAATLSFMREDAGIHFEPSPDITAEEKHFLQKNFAAILRENPEKAVAKDEIAMPAAALIAESSVNGKRIIEEMIIRHAGNQNLSILEAAVDYIEKYASVLLPGVLTLITKYGISMEVHLQNCVSVFRNGMPERVIVRDNGGIRVMGSRLHHFTKHAELNNSTNLMTEERTELLDIFFHSVIHNHFGEIIVLVARRLAIDENELWLPIRKVVQHVYEALRRDASVPEESLKDEELIFSEHSSMKALVRMRLTDKFTENAYVHVENPISFTNEVVLK